MSAALSNPGPGASASTSGNTPVSASVGVPAPVGQLSQPEPDAPTAVERLERSREQIRESMRAMASPAPQRLSATGEPMGSGSMLDTLIERALALPAVEIVIDTAQSWWKHHPWRAVGMVAADAGREVVTPIARRHPVYLMLGAAAFGALLLRWGPWRWVAKRTLIAGLLPRLATRVAANVPLESWLSALSVLRRPKPGSSARTEVRRTP